MLQPAMRRMCVVMLAMGCSSERAATERAAAGGGAITTGTGPLVVIDIHSADANRAKLAAAASAALQRAGMSVRDGEDINEVTRGGLFSGSIESSLPPGVPPKTAALWRAGADRCRPQRERCPQVSSSNEEACTALMRCTQSVAPAVRESWLRELGATAWIHVVAGPTEQHEGVEGPDGFFAKAWGHTLCEPKFRELRVGAESDIMMVGSDAPVPTTEAAAIETAAALVVRIARGEGTPTERGFLAHVPRPADDAATLTLLGCTAP
jgi:hypothetical protein